MSYDDETALSPFARPGFIAAAVVVAVILILGIILGVRAFGDDDPAPQPAATGPSTASPDPVDDAALASVCGLAGVDLDGNVTSPPDSEWAYQGVIAFPTSPVYGPGRTDGDGIRSCFQHSPEGALFAAANALVQPFDAEHAAAWMNEFLADGPYREDILKANSSGGTQPSDTRLGIAGFRLLDYDGDSALVDLAVKATSGGTAVTGSYAYELVWQEGDWKLSAETAAPFNYATLPDLAGYVTWGE